jgi:enamine deaminase RidA (YjgF/YER057c/UK114 family)
MAEVSVYNPDTIAKPVASYSHCALVTGASKLLFIAGQVALDPAGKLVGANDCARQCSQVYANLDAALKSAGADWKHVVQLMAFLVRKEDIAAYRGFRNAEMARLYPDGRYPPSTLTVISALAGDEFLVEIQAVAAI